MAKHASPKPKSPGRKAPERANQRYRTRKDLIAAAERLMKNGHKPSLEEVAAAARVSRATAYRYFPNVEALLIEAPLESAATARCMSSAMATTAWAWSGRAMGTPPTTM